MKVDPAEIFVVFPAFHDYQAFQTVRDALHYSLAPESIRFGIHLMYGSEDIYNFFKSHTDNNYYDKNKVRYSHEKITKDNIYEKLGVGYGRHSAYKHYDGEKYILQIDAHTSFCHGWDQILKETLEESKEYTKTDRTVLTAYCGGFKVDKNSKRIKPQADQVFRYQYLYNDKMYQKDHENTLHYWMPEWRTDLPNPEYNSYVPATKFAANFSFGEIYLVDYLPKKTLFMEEELIQTINIMDDNIVLIHPSGLKPIINHLYITKDQPRTRATINDFLEPFEETWLEQEQIINYLTFMRKKGNAKKIHKYEEYARTRLIKGKRHIHLQGFIPFLPN